MYEYSNPSLALDVLSDLQERINKNYRPIPKASNTDKFIDENLMKINRGKSFKGHEAAVSINTHKKETTLTISNKYLGGWVGYFYNVQQNMTEMSLLVDFSAPKWYTKKINNIQTKLKDHNKIKVQLNKTKFIRISEHSAELVDRTNTEGLVMYGHRKNIDMITENRNILSRFRKWFKGVDYNQLEFIGVTSDEPDSFDQQEKTWLITNFKI